MYGQNVPRKNTEKGGVLTILCVIKMSVTLSNTQNYLFYLFNTLEDEKILKNYIIDIYLWNIAFIKKEVLNLWKANKESHASVTLMKIDI